MSICKFVAKMFVYIKYLLYFCNVKLRKRLLDKVLTFRFG